MQSRPDWPYAKEIPILLGMRGSVLRTLAMLSAAMIATAYVLPAVIEVADYRVVAHRGHLGDGPQPEHTENTLPALEEARRAGATAVEVDLRLTRDRRVLVMHDKTLDRTTTCTGEVSKRTLDDVQNRCRGRVDAERLPDVRDVLEWARKRRMHLLLEIKVPSRDTWTVDDLARLDRVVARAGMHRRVSVSSFSSEVLAMVESVNPRRRTHWIVKGWPGVSRIAAAADVAHLSTRVLTRARVEALHRTRTRVIGRHTDRLADWQRLQELEADGLVVDRTAEYVRWRGDRRNSVAPDAHRR